MLKGKDLISIHDLSADEVQEILNCAADLKVMQKNKIPHAYLSGKTLGMIFEKSSTRTRVSFEVGIFQLGGSEWTEFSRWMYDSWIPQQHADGYWDRKENDRYYQTAMVILAFTVPYRLLPIYQRDETVDEKP